MRALAALLACIASLAALSGGAATAQVSQPAKPASVKAWLGTWSTTSGRVVIHDASYQPTVKFTTKCPCSWYLQGQWFTSGDNSGFSGPLNSNGTALSAGWAMGNGRFGDLRMARTGGRFTGFHKPCHGGFCKTTKWSGRRHSARIWRVGFRFTQNGLPKEHTTIRTRSGGAGSLAFDGVPRAADTGYLSRSTRYFHIDVIPEAVDLAITLEAPLRSGGIYRRRPNGTRTLLISAEVTKSNDPKCPVGSLMYFDLADGQGASPDSAKLRPYRDDGCRGHTESWTSTRRGARQRRHQRPGELGVPKPAVLAQLIEGRNSRRRRAPVGLPSAAGESAGRALR